MLYIGITCLTDAWLSSIEQKIMSHCQKEVKFQITAKVQALQILFWAL